MKRGKKYRAVITKIDRAKKYSLEEACALVSEGKVAKFDESIDVAFNLGVDPRQSDQQVRGAVSLPHGLGKKVRVIVFAKGDKVKEALEAGAIEAGGDELVEKVEGGWMDFEKVVSTPDMMAKVSKLGKVLGPRGMMPNPKVGTVTFEVGEAVGELIAGKVEFRVDKGGIIHASVGKISFGSEKIKENVKVLVDALIRLKPSSSKGVYLQKLVISSTMGPGVRVDTISLQQ